MIKVHLSKVLLLLYRNRIAYTLLEILVPRLRASMIFRLDKLEFSCNSCLSSTFIGIFVI